MMFKRLFNKNTVEGFKLKVSVTFDVHRSIKVYSSKVKRSFSISKWVAVSRTFYCIIQNYVNSNVTEYKPDHK